MPDQYYGGAIWTHHALDRLGERGLSQGLAWQALKFPDNTLQGKNPSTIEFQKKVQGSTVTLIAKKNEKKEWIILSCWIDPPLPGTEDFKKKQDYLRSKNAGFWGKIWYSLKRQLGL